MPKGNLTLRVQLLRLLLIPFFIVLFLGVAGSFFLVRNAANDVYDRELNEIARELLLHVTKVDGQLKFDLTAEAERTLLLDEFDTVFYAIHTTAGKTIAGDPALPAVNLHLRGRDTAFADRKLQGQPVRVAVLVGKPLVQNSTEPVLIYVAETKVKRDHHKRALLLQVILPQVLLILLGGTMIWLGVAHGLAPLTQLQQAVEMRSHLDLSPLAVQRVPGEVEPLVVAVNDLMKRVESVLGFQGRFIADTAHQLRTPVAGLKAHIELALREEDVSQIKRALGHLYTSAERLSRLVSQLLSLARNEPQNVRTTTFVPFDLNRLARRTTQEWVPHAYKKNIDLGFEGATDSVFISGETVRVTELINNLLDNAIRYTPEGKRVTVRVVAEGNANLIISDDGPRIPVEEHERIFQRFHRLLGTHEEGSGLGLAIVYEIATLHNATIKLKDDPDGLGNTFIVSFPMLTQVA